MIGWIILVVSLVLAIGIFLYYLTLESQKDLKRAIDDLKKMNKNMNTLIKDLEGKKWR